MASTKIINVLKDDRFEEILELFKNTQAEDVVFVLPKTSRAFKKEEHFAILNTEAEKSNKKISLLCSSPEVNKLANKHNFEILLANKNVAAKPVRISDEDPEELNEGIIENTEEDNLKSEDDDYEETPKEVLAKDVTYGENDHYYEIVTASKTPRNLEGIVKQSGRPLRVLPKKERPINLDVRNETDYQNIDDIKNVWEEQDRRVKNKGLWSNIQKRTQKSFKNFPKKSLTIFGVISVLLFAVIVYVSTGSAKIDLTPFKSVLDIPLKVSSSDKFSVVELGLNRIPGQLFNVEKNASQTFSATGEKEVAQKARGNIMVYNEYGTTPQILVATTRFQTSDGLIFRTLKGITVPGTRVENGKIIPGSIAVEVIADKPGQAYNISATKFFIPAFNEKGDAGRYEKIYGKSDKNMSGGIVGKAKIVTEEDFNNAKQSLTEQVKKSVTESLKSQTSGLKTLNDANIKIIGPESSAKVDEATESFVMSVTGKIDTIGFKESDLRNLIGEFIGKNNNLTVISEKLTLNYSNVAFDETANILTFTVNIKGNGYPKIDSEKIKSDLSGKDERGIKEYFRGSKTIESVKVLLSPFWVRRVPQNSDKINIRMNY